MDKLKFILQDLHEYSRFALMTLDTLSSEEHRNEGNIYSLYNDIWIIDHLVKNIFTLLPTIPELPEPPEPEYPEDRG